MTNFFDYYTDEAVSYIRRNGFDTYKGYAMIAYAIIVLAMAIYHKKQ